MQLLRLATAVALLTATAIAQSTSILIDCGDPGLTTTSTATSTWNNGAPNTSNPN